MTEEGAGGGRIGQVAAEPLASWLTRLKTMLCACQL